MKVVQIGDFQEREQAGLFRASAVVDGEEVWFESADVRLQATPEALLSAFLIPAQKNGDVLRCDEPVCPEWRANIDRLMAMTEPWWGKNSPRPLVPITEAAPPPPVSVDPAEAGPVLFFSAGVDSFFTLCQATPRPAALLNVAGFDIKLPLTERQAAASACYREIAAATGLRSLTVRTNLREHSYFQRANWLITHGGALAAVAHLMGGSYGHFRISATHRGEDDIALGSHPATDPLWSSRAVTFDHWGADHSRTEKLRALARDPLARSHLRVCWEHAGVAANCGECRKCVLTRLSLAWLGEEDAFAARFADARPLPELISGWEYWRTFLSSATLDEVLDQPGHLSLELRTRLTAHRRQPDRPLSKYHVHRTGRAHAGKEGLLPDTLFAPVLRLSQGKTVYYHKVAGNVGDDLIHAGAAQLFARFGIQMVDRPEAAEQVVLCGGGNLGIWENCEREREKIYELCRRRKIPLILHPQSVAGPGVTLPEEVTHRFVRDRYSQQLFPGARLAPDLALALHVPADADFIEAPAFPVGVFLRTDREGLFGDHKESLGDPRHAVERDWREYIRLASTFHHVITDRLHFGVSALLAGRRVTLLPNAYHKIRGVWEAWLKDLGCAWAEDPSLALAEQPRRRVADWTRPAPRPPRPASNEGLAMVACVHNEEAYLEPYLRYHHALGVDRAYLFLDRCTDRTADIAAAFPWVKVFDRPTPEEPHYCRTYQVECMDEALVLAREEGLAWLLHLDPDEFAFAGNEEAASSAEMHALRPDQRASPQRKLWQQASLSRLLRTVPPHILQVVMETREALPRLLGDEEPFWKQDVFLRPGDDYPHTILDPQTGERRKPKKWLGHTLGKALIRTTARVQAFNAHRWTSWQGCHPPVFPQCLSLPTWQRGWHAHFHDFRPRPWLKKYRAIARQHAHWPDQKRMDFPKLEWSRAAVGMDEAAARAYLAEGVLSSPEEGDAPANGNECPADGTLARLLEEITGVSAATTAAAET